MVPAVRIRKPLGEINTDPKNPYKPTMNTYETIEVGDAKLVKVTPKPKTPERFIDENFKWDEIMDKNENSVHSSLILQRTSI